MKDSGKRWLDIPVFITDDDSSEIHIETSSKENTIPKWVVSQRIFEVTENDFNRHLPSLDFLKRQFMDGKLEPLNTAAEEVDRLEKEKTD